MSEVTYYFDVIDPVYYVCGGITLQTRWDGDHDYWIDGLLTTYAYTVDSGCTQSLQGNTCPGTDLGTISKVELRVYGYGDGGDRIDLHPFFGGIDGGTQGDEYQLTMPSSADWSSYADITNDSNAPSPWTWADIEDLDCNCEYDPVGKGNAIYAAKVEIRVTYTGLGGYYHGLKVQGVGELALCDVGSHPLRIRKGGTTYGIELVAVDDPNASKIRIKTSAGIKAIRKYT